MYGKPFGTCQNDDVCNRIYGKKITRKVSIYSTNRPLKLKPKLIIIFGGKLMDFFYGKPLMKLMIFSYRIS